MKGVWRGYGSKPLVSKHSGFAGWWQRTTKTRLIYMYLLRRPLLVMSIMTFYPLLYQVWMSFTDYGIKNIRFDAPPPNWFGFQNYTGHF